MLSLNERNNVIFHHAIAHCSAVLFAPIVVASGYFGYVGCTWLLLVLFRFLVVATLRVLAGAGVMLCVDRPS
jgi:hypothetical protein